MFNFIHPVCVSTVFAFCSLEPTSRVCVRVSVTYLSAKSTDMAEENQLAHTTTDDPQVRDIYLELARGVLFFLELIDFTASRKAEVINVLWGS